MFSKVLLTAAFAAIAGVATAKPIEARDIAFSGPIPVWYCCVNNCRNCWWTECQGNPHGCANSFFPSCCGMMVFAKTDEDIDKQHYNMKGELVEFISRTSGQNGKRDEDGGKQYYNDHGELVEFVTLPPE